MLLTRLAAEVAAEATAELAGVEFMRESVSLIRQASRAMLCELAAER